MNAKEWADQLRTEGDCEHEREMFTRIADAIDALNAKYERAIDCLKYVNKKLSFSDGIHPNSISGLKMRKRMAAILAEHEEEK